PKRRRLSRDFFVAALQRDLGADLADDQHDGRLGAEQRLLQGRVLSSDQDGREDQDAERRGEPVRHRGEFYPRWLKARKAPGVAPWSLSVLRAARSLLQLGDRGLGLRLRRGHVTSLARSLGLLDQRSSLGAAGLGGTGHTRRLHILTAGSLNVLTTRRLNVLTARSLHILTTRRLHVLTARSLHILTARRLNILATRSLHVLTARRLDILATRSLHILTARRLDILATRSLHSLAARGLNILTTRGLNVLTARSLHVSASANQRARSLRRS